jgi:hypothetical protein
MVCTMASVGSVKAFAISMRVGNHSHRFEDRQHPLLTSLKHILYHKMIHLALVENLPC